MPPRRFSKCKKIHCFAGFRPILAPWWLAWVRSVRSIRAGPPHAAAPSLLVVRTTSTQVSPHLPSTLSLSVTRVASSIWVTKQHPAGPRSMKGAGTPTCLLATPGGGGCCWTARAAMDNTGLNFPQGHSARPRWHRGSSCPLMSYCPKWVHLCSPLRTKRQQSEHGQSRETFGWWLSASDLSSFRLQTLDLQT